MTAGRSLTQALTSLAATGPQPLRDAFARFPALARMLGTVAALEIVKEELADPTSDRVIEVLVLAQERGGRIVREVLEDLVVATTKDLKVLDEIETEGLEMRINARAVLVMPWFVLVALTARPGAFRAFYQSTGRAPRGAGRRGAERDRVRVDPLARGASHSELRVFGSAAIRRRERGRISPSRLAVGRPALARASPACVVRPRSRLAPRVRPVHARSRVPVSVAAPTRCIADRVDGHRRGTLGRLFGPPVLAGVERSGGSSNAAPTRRSRLSLAPGRLVRRHARRVPHPRPSAP